MKKVLILAVAFVITMSATAYAALNIFPDVVQNTWYTESIEDVYLKGLMTGYEDGNFGPNEMMTRGQLAVVLSRYDKHLHNTLQSQYGLSFVCPDEAIVDCPYGRELGAACMNPVYVDWAVANCSIPGYEEADFNVYDTGTFMFEYPADWTIDVDGNPVGWSQFVEFFDGDGDLVAELGCPILETGYEAWLVDKETKEYGGDYRIEFWKATVNPEYGDSGLEDFAFILMYDDEEWTNTCQISNFGIGETDQTLFNKFEEIYDSVQ
ncbi:S-layer homology domain-containing protein [Patescibacteria group bacterium]